MDALVVDASVALKWVLPEEDSDRALALQGTELHAPDLLLAECGNAFWVRVRCGLLSKGEAGACFAELSRAPIRWLATGDASAEAVALALDLDHPVYDCVYLAAATMGDMPLVTADRRLLRSIDRRPALARYLKPLADIG